MVNVTPEVIFKALQEGVSVEGTYLKSGINQSRVGEVFNLMYLTYRFRGEKPSPEWRAGGQYLAIEIYGEVRLLSLGSANPYFKPPSYFTGVGYLTFSRQATEEEQKQWGESVDVWADLQTSINAALNVIEQSRQKVNCLPLKNFWDWLGSNHNLADPAVLKLVRERPEFPKWTELNLPLTKERILLLTEQLIKLGNCVRPDTPYAQISEIIKAELTTSHRNLVEVGFELFRLEEQPHR